MARRPQKNIRAAASTPTSVRTQTVAATKLALGTVFLGASFLAAAAAASMPALPRPVTAITPIGATMVSQALSDRVLLIPADPTGVDNAPIMSVSLTVPPATTAKLRALTFNIIRATDTGWAGDSTGCGFSQYSLTTAEGDLLGVATKKPGDSSATRFVLSSPLVISNQTTLQLRPVEFFAEATKLETAQMLHGCRLLSVLAPANVDLVGENDQPLPVLSGPVYGTLTQMLAAQPTVSWSVTAPPALITNDTKAMVLARVEIKNVTGADQTINLKSLPIVIRSNAQTIEPVTITWTADNALQSAYTQTLLPEEWGVQNSLTVSAPVPTAWVLKANQTLNFTLSIEGALKGQPGWYACTSIPTDSLLTWNFGTGSAQTSPAALSEFCVTKP